MILWLTVFILTAFADMAWTRWTLEANRGNALMAAVWGAAIVALGGFTTIQFVENHWILTATISGGFVGTYVTVKYSKR